MSADAVASAVLKAMGEVGIPTSMFKSHSLRGGVCHHYDGTWSLPGVNEAASWLVLFLGI